MGRRTAVPGRTGRKEISDQENEGRQALEEREEQERAEREEKEISDREAKEAEEKARRDEEEPERIFEEEREKVEGLARECDDLWDESMEAMDAGNQRLSDEKMQDFEGCSALLSRERNRLGLPTPTPPGEVIIGPVEVKPPAPAPAPPLPAPKPHAAPKAPRTATARLRVLPTRAVPPTWHRQSPALGRPEAAPRGRRAASTGPATVDFRRRRGTSRADRWAPRGRGGIGIRARFRSWWASARGGSSPSARTLGVAGNASGI